MARKSKRRKRVEKKRQAELAAQVAKTRIVADLSKQAPNNSYSPPEYYEDVKFNCLDCGCTEVWTAKQQQWWYEVAKGPVQSTAIRCRLCRAKVRKEREENHERSEKGRIRKLDKQI